MLHHFFCIRHVYYETVKTQEGVHCSVIEHGKMSLSFQTAVQKNEAKLSFLCSLKTEEGFG